MKRILVAEDNDVNARLLIAMLDKTYEVVRARTGKEVLELVITRHFDLILMDLEMPELDGWETTRLLRQQRRLWMTPILAASAYVNYWQTAQLAGCTDYISKPYKPHDVLAKVARYVGS
jgi:CheY-like chemotaxis protein